MADQQFIRIRGRIQGPFSYEQLQKLARAGQFSRLHEVSNDGVNWRRASESPELFSMGQDAPAKTSAPEQTTIHEFTLEPPNIGPPTQGVPGQSWYFHQFGKSQGPVDFARLQQMADAGQLVGEDLVWKEGMPEWIHAARVTGLIRPADSMSAKQQLAAGPALAPFAHLLMDPPRVSGLAVASLVLGILWLGGIGSLLAIIFGGVAMHQIRGSHGRITGTGLAVAGLTLGIVFGSLQVIAMVMTQMEMAR